MRRRSLPSVLLLGLALAVPSGAAAAATPSTVKLSFTTAKPGKHAGVVLKGTFAKDATGANRMLTDFVLTLPAGTKTDPSGAAKCTATNEQLSDGGAPKQCPPASQVGTGSAHALIGDSPDPLTFDGTVWNHKSGLLLDLALNGTSAYGITGARTGDRRYDFALSKAKELNARAIDISMRIGSATKGYFRTPASCPKGGWKATTKQTYDDGTRETTKIVMPCKKR